MLSQEVNDLLNLFSFIIGMENLELNITQNDLQEQTAEIDKKVDAKFQKALDEIHAHLEQQDVKLERILKYIYENH